MREAVYRMEIEATEDRDGRVKGDIIIMQNSIFDKSNGLAFFDLGKGWKVNWYHQFTGIKDKTNSYIFENDILEITSKNHHVLSYYKVIYNNNDACFSLINAKGEGDKYGIYTRKLGLLGDILYKVGNIIEHPDLLSSL